MISVQQAKQLLNENVQLLEPVNLGLEEAAGHILAEDIFALYDIPAFEQSSMDGYAFKYEPSQSTLKLAGEMAAGTSQSLTIKSGECSRIFTGAPLPIGADTVVMQEKIDRVNEQITIKDEKISLGLNVRDVGSEIKSGALAMQKGDLLSPAALGFLAGIGVKEVKVYPMPKVSIILTGNELQKPGVALAFGQVYESNSYALIAALKSEGITEIELLWAIDDLEALTQLLKDALTKSDLVLLTGGVSVGDYDFVIDASKNCGVKEIFHKVKQKPGKPLFFGTKNQKLIFGLPGNPSSVLSCYYNYVLPALKKLSQKENSVKQISAKLAKEYKKPSGLTHFLKGSFKDGMVTPLSAQESYRLSSFAQANCLICLNEEHETVIEGENVTILVLPS